MLIMSHTEKKLFREQSNDRASAAFYYNKGRFKNQKWRLIRPNFCIKVIKINKELTKNT